MWKKMAKQNTLMTFYVICMKYYSMLNTTLLPSKERERERERKRKKLILELLPVKKK